MSPVGLFYFFLDIIIALNIKIECVMLTPFMWLLFLKYTNFAFRFLPSIRTSSKRKKAFLIHISASFSLPFFIVKPLQYVPARSFSLLHGLPYHCGTQELSRSLKLLRLHVGLSRLLPLHLQL